MPPIQEIRDEIADGRLGNALELMQNHFSDTIHLLAQYNTGNRQHNLGLTSNADWNVTQARLTSAALGMLSDYERKEERKASRDKSEGNSSANTNDKNKGPKPMNVFLSYSHKDEEYKNELDVFLSPLKRNKKINVWNDRKIKPGDTWDESIEDALNNADLILFLVSPYLFASDYIYEKELAIAMKRREKENIKVVPIFVRHALFDETPLGKLQGLPKDAKPISSFADKDSAYLEIAKAIQAILKPYNL